MLPLRGLCEETFWLCSLVKNLYMGFIPSYMATQNHLNERQLSQPWLSFIAMHDKNNIKSWFLLIRSCRVDFSFTTPTPISSWLCCLDLGVLIRSCRVDFSFTTPTPISGWLCCLDLRAGAYLGVKFFELPNLGYMESDKMDPEFRYGHGDRML